MRYRDLLRVGLSSLIAGTLGCAGAQRSPTAAPRPVTAASDTLASDIDAYVSGFGKHWGSSYAFSGYIAVVRDGKPLLSKGYGAANLARGLVADANTRFRVGSVTKQFTAVAIMQLVEQQKLSLDASVRTYLPQLPDSFRAVTLHHLLSHTSGVASYTDIAELMEHQERSYAPGEVLASFVHTPLAFRPGERFAYSNSNYFLLGLVIEKASGVNYERYLQSHVLGPAGMRRTSTIDAPDAPNTAVGYRVEGEQRVPVEPIDMSLPFAAGALRSTPDDLRAWDRALAGDTLLSAASKRRLLTPNLDQYAYGFFIGSEAGYEIQAHGGGIRGFNAFLARVPSGNLQIIVLSNDESFEPDIGGAIIQRALTGQKLPSAERAASALPRELNARIAGSYGLTDEARSTVEKIVPAEFVESFATIAVVPDGDRTYLAPVGQPRLELFVSPDGQLFTKRGGVVVMPEPAGGQFEALSLLQHGLSLRFARKHE